jgi:hypothetical protein
MSAPPSRLRTSQDLLRAEGSRITTSALTRIPGSTKMEKVRGSFAAGFRICAVVRVRARRYPYLAHGPRSRPDKLLGVLTPRSMRV